MKDDGVSMIVEYMILASIMAIFTVFLSLNLSSILEESQLTKVVENQFSDVSAQISSQIVDMIAVYPRNGNMTAKVFMPQKIGDVKYVVALENNQIKIVSDDNRFFKVLSLGALPEVGIIDIGGLTHSLKESHELVYRKISCIYPTAVLKVNPKTVLVGNSFEIDVSDSSPGSSQSFKWKVTLWDNISYGWFDSVNNKTLNVSVESWSSSWQGCEYNQTAKIAFCNITLEVSIFCEGNYLNSSTKRVLLVAKPESEGYGNITIDKFVEPSQVEVGQTAYLHVRLDALGLSGGKIVNLTTVLTLDTSGSMGDLSLVGNNVAKILELSTQFQRLQGLTDNNKKGVVTIALPDSLDTYYFIAVEVPEQYSGFEISKIENINCPQQQKCFCTDNKRLCYIKDLTPGNKKIEVTGADKNLNFEVIVYLPKIDSLKLSAISYLKALKEGDFAGLVEYDNKAVVKQVNSSSYLKNLTTDKATVIGEVKSMTADGATNIYHALWKANQTLYENTTITGGTIPLIILMTDGLPTVEAYSNRSDCHNYGFWFIEDNIGFCRYGSWCRPNCYIQIEQLANQIKQNKIGDQEIRICTIGFGREGEYNATLLRNIASYINETTKCYFDARNHEQLQNAFRTIKNYFDVIATNLTITDVLPSYVQIEEEPEVLKVGLPVCSNITFVKDDENRSILKLNCSEIRLEDAVEIVVPIKFNQPGTYILNVPEISNVTYYDINRQFVTVPLKVVSVRYGTPSSAQVIIK